MNALPNPLLPGTPEPPRGAARRIAAWIAGILVAIAVIAVVAGILLLRSPSFHQYVLKMAEREASQAAGVPIQARSFSFRLANLGLDLYDVRALGAHGHPYPLCWRWITLD